MAFSFSEYSKMFLSLFPRGRAWSREADSVLNSLADAHAEELVRIDERSADLLKERDVRKTLELLDDYERDLGLPDECTEEAGTIQMRRLVAYAKYISEGGLNKQTYIDLADDIGFEITIDEFTPCWSGIACSGDPIGDQSNIFYWQINVYVTPESWVYFTSGASVCGDQLIYVAGTAEFLCVLNKYKPAHTIIIWNYFGPEFSAAFNNAFNAIPSDDTAWLQGAFTRAFGEAFDVYYGGGEFDNAFDSAFYKPL